MSKEKEPIRSRRQLRAQLAQTNGTTDQPAVPSASMPKTGEPIANEDATPPTVLAEPSTPPRVEASPRERESQTRARDRAALRAYKELLDPAELNPLPSRRALRQAQLDADRAPITAVNPVVSAAAATPASQGSTQSPATQPAPKVTTNAPSAESGQGGSASKVAGTAPAIGLHEAAAAAQESRPASGTSPRTRAGRRASARPVDESPATSAASAQLPAVQPPPLPATSPSAPANTNGRSAEENAKTVSGSPDKNSASTGSYSPLPGLVPGGNYYPVSAGPPTGALPVATPTTDELNVLAAQRADTERAAVLTQRAQARERLAQESARNRRPASDSRPASNSRPEPSPVADPTATNNLAMVTPLVFVDAPSGSGQVLRPPSTTHVPIVTRSTPQQKAGSRKPLPRPEKKAAAAARAPGNTAAGSGTVTRSSSEVETQAQATVPQSNAVPKASAMPNASAARFDAALSARTVNRPGPGNRPLTGGRSNTLKRAEAMATGGHPTVAPAVGHRAEHSADAATDVPVEVHRSQMPPMPADYAHGLEPLDAMTAGLGRIQRNRLLQWGSLVVGGAALVVSVILFITTLTR